MRPPFSIQHCRASTLSNPALPCVHPFQSSAVVRPTLPNSAVLCYNRTTRHSPLSILISPFSILPINIHHFSRLVNRQRMQIIVLRRMNAHICKITNTQIAGRRWNNHFIFTSPGFSFAAANMRSRAMLSDSYVEPAITKFIG